MPIEALFVLFALALICAVTFGYCLRALMEGASRRTNVYPPRRIEGYRSHAWSSAFGDVDDRLVDFSPEYGGKTKW